ncbi:MAG: GNAT family N-acetyltransferase [Lachnospiraceae bacterium]|nr:GNAT family N-acetyltransferase [Lachnospiraceae bacterium]
MVEIRQIKRTEYDAAMNLAWCTFLQFEADVYTKQGVLNFQNFIRDPLLERMFFLGEYLIFGAFLEGELVGIAGVRNRSHLSLLFVKKEHHRMGIGSALVAFAIQHCHKEFKAKRYTVNSSPYAVEFYHRFGFGDVSEQITRDGIIYTPMEYYIGKESGDKK